MNKQILIQKIEQNLSQRDIARELGKSQTTIKYWLKKYELRTHHNKYNKSNKSNKDHKRKCTVCGKQIYERKICQGCYTKIRRYRNKKEAVRIKGGKCEECGWHGPLAGFCFHHRKEKKYEISDAANKSWKVLKKEISKCDLLCLTCHSIKHSNINSKFLKAVDIYKGKSF